MMIGIAVIGQPLIREYMDCPLTCKIKDDSNNDETQDDEGPVSEQISAFEAIAPAAQIQVVSTDFFILDLSLHNNYETEIRSTLFIEKASQKLLKVLFNNIIAPNAP